MFCYFCGCYMINFTGSNFCTVFIADMLYNENLVIADAICSKSPPPSLKSVTYILQWWNLAQLYLTERRSKKYINHMAHPLSSADISIFHRKSAIFIISRNTNVDCILMYNFFKGCFDKHGCNFHDISKIGYSRPS